MKFLTICLSLMFAPAIALAGPSRAPKAPTAQPAPQTQMHTDDSGSASTESGTVSDSTNKPVKNVRRAQYSEYLVGLSTWQEDIQATRGTEKSPMRTQSVGVNLGYNWDKFFAGSNWRQWHTVDLTVGQVKGKGSTTGIPDELKKQSFYMAGFAPGLMWRTSPVSEFGVALPLVYRMIKWDLIPTSGLKMDKASSFSAGGSLTYVARFTGRNSVHVTVTHQHMWDSVSWNFGFNRVF